MVDRGCERRAFAVLCMSASALRAVPRPDQSMALREHILALAQRQKRYGVGVIHLKLTQAGLRVNYKRVERLYEDAKLQFRRRKRKKVPVGERQPLLRPNAAKPGKPNQNACIEYFNGRFRDEYLNEHWFTCLAHVRIVIDAWYREYNEERPKKILGGLTPAAYAKQLGENRLH